jgi:hypothetical protein
MIKDCVNVFKLNKAGVLVGFPKFGIRSVEVTTTTASNGGNLCQLSECGRARTKSLREKVHVSTVHTLYLLIIIINQ